MYKQRNGINNMNEAANKHQEKMKAEIKNNIEFLNHFSAAELSELCKTDGYPVSRTKGGNIVTISRKWATRDIGIFHASANGYTAEAAANA